MRRATVGLLLVLMLAGCGRPSVEDPLQVTGSSDFEVQASIKLGGYNGPVLARVRDTVTGTTCYVIYNHRGNSIDCPGGRP